MASPKVSIVIPSFNCAAWLAHAVDSAQKQSYANLEIVVVDDCSTDTTPRLMAHLAGKDGRIVSIRNEKNMGRSASRNVGNEAATGDIIMVLDADDIAYANRAKLTVDALKKAEFVYGAADSIDCFGRVLGRNLADVFDKDSALKSLQNHIVHSTCAYTKEIAKQIPYREGEIAALGIDDWALQIEALLTGVKFNHIPGLVGAYRHLETGISATRDEAKVRAAKLAFLTDLGVMA